MLGAIVGSALSGIAGYASAKATNKSNEAMSQKQMDFQERMSNTAHQREVKDLRKAGLNPILSVNKGASTPAGSMATMEDAGAAAINAASASHAMRIQRQQVELQKKELGVKQQNIDLQREKTRLEALRLTHDKYRDTRSLDQQESHFNQDLDFKKLSFDKTHKLDIQKHNRWSDNLDMQEKQIQAAIENTGADTLLKKVQTKAQAVQVLKMFAETLNLEARTKTELINSEVLQQTLTQKQVDTEKLSKELNLLRRKDRDQAKLPNWLRVLGEGIKRLSPIF